MTADNSTPHQSAEYDTKVRKTIPYYNTFHDETIKLLKASGIKADNWLDTGCGTASLIKKALPEFPDTTFYLADPAETMLEEAKKKFTLTEIERIHILSPAAAQDIFPDTAGTFNVITAVQSLHYLSRDMRKKAVENCYSLLTGNGIFITFENIRPLTEKGTEIGKRNWGNFQLAQGKTEKDVSEHLDRFGKEYFPITIEEHLALLRESGFSTVEIFWFSCMQAGFYGIK